MWYCDRKNPNIIARDQSAKNSERIPKIIDIDGQNAFLKGNIIELSGSDEATEQLLQKLVSKLVYYQAIEYAKKGPTSQQFHRYASPICSNNNINDRPDIYRDAQSNLGIVKIEDKELLQKFVTAIIKLCLDLGMRVEDIPKVTIVSLYFGILAGMGVHGDYPTVDDANDLSCRLLIRYGGPQTIEFAGYSCEKNDTMASHKVDGLSYEIESSEGTMAYLTTPFSNGKLMMCWADMDKKTGIQVKHRVKKIEPTHMPAVNFVIDFPITSLQAVTDAKANFKNLGNGKLKLDLSG